MKAADSFIKSKPAPYVALITAMIIWGGSFVALKLSFRSFHPFFVVFIRMALASIVFIPFIWKHFKKVKKDDIFWLLLMAFFEPCIYYIFEAKALMLTTASQAGMITAMLPVLVAVPSIIFLKEKISRRTGFGFAVAIAGVIWLSLGGKATDEAPNPILGNLLEFMAMVCAAGYTIILKKLSSRYSPFFLTSVQTFVGTLFFLPIILLTPGAFVMSPTLSGILILVFLGIVVTIGAYGFYNFGTSRIPASQSTAFVNLIPVVALIISMIFLGERLTFFQYIASAMVLFGVIFSQDRTPDEIPVY